MGTLKFLIIWSLLGSIAIGALVVLMMLVLTYGPVWLLALPLAFIIIGLCFAGSAEASIRL